MMITVKILNLLGWYRRAIKISNQKEIRKFRDTTNSVKCLFFVSPADFNSIEEVGLISDKTAYIGEILQNNGYECIYLLKETLISESKLPRKISTWPHPVVTQQLRFRTLFFVLFTRFFEKTKKVSSTKIPSHSSNTLLGQFFYSSLQITLMELKPDVVFTIGAPQELLEICQGLEMKVFEVMHGVFNQAEISREFLIKSSYKPDVFLTWHSSYSELLSENGINAFTLGHPNLKLSNQEPRNLHQSPTYLITLEHGIRDSEDVFGVIDKRLFDFAKCLPTHECNVIFRVHPVIASQSKLFLEVEKWLHSHFQNCSVESPLKVSLLDSLRKVDVQISYRSSTFFEAALLGIPTVLISDVSSRHVPDELVTSKYIYQAEDFRDVDLNAIASIPLRPLDFLMKEEHVLRLLNSWNL